MFEIQLKTGAKIQVEDLYGLQDEIRNGINECEEVSQFTCLDDHLVFPCGNLNNALSILEVLDNGFMYPYELIQLINDHYITDNGDWIENVDNFNKLKVGEVSASENDAHEDFYEEAGKLIADNMELFSHGYSIEKIPNTESVYYKNFNFAKFGKDHLNRTSGVEYFNIDQLIFFSN